MEHTRHRRRVVINTLLLDVLLVASGVHSFLIEDHFGPLDVAGFNVRHFGRGFMDEPERVSKLVKIMDLFDIVLVQEVRDGSGTALDDLKTSLVSTTGNSWTYIASQPVGRSKTYKEQYVFFYKTTSAKFIKSHQVNDDAKDVYEREPFCAEFEYSSTSASSSSSTTNHKRIVLMAIHTKPLDTKAELQALPNTIKFVASTVFPHAPGVITFGDMNADCNYLTGIWRSSIDIFNGPDFRSLIPDSADSATKDSSDCAYDRIVVYGGPALDVRNASVFNFQAWLKLGETEALEVSDHYPVHFLLY